MRSSIVFGVPSFFFSDSLSKFVRMDSTQYYVIGTRFKMRYSIYFGGSNEMRFSISNLIFLVLNENHFFFFFAQKAAPRSANRLKSNFLKLNAPETMDMYVVEVNRVMDVHRTHLVAVESNNIVYCDAMMHTLILCIVCCIIVWIWILIYIVAVKCV